MRERTACGVLLSLAIASGCASPDVDPRPDQEAARSLVRASTGQAEVYDPDAAPLSTPEIEATLADGLGLDEALRLALLNNRRLQAGFAGLGVARADFEQAGLLENPSLGIAFLLPSGGGQPKIVGDLVQSIVDLWEIPLRQDVAHSAIERQILEVSRFAGELVADTKTAYYESVAAGELLATSRESANVAQATLDAVAGRVEGGVATTTERSLAQSQALGARLSLLNAERESFGARRRLAALLSLNDDLMDVVLTDGLPDPDLVPFQREVLVERSRSHRLDLRAAQGAVRTAESELALEHRRAIPSIEVGAFFERPESGSSVDFLGGPGAKIEIPIFDRNDVQIRRAEFRRDQLEREYEALVSEVDQQVRAAVDRAAAAARSARFVADELLPQAERSAALARTAYDLGNTTLLPMLESQRAVIQARLSQVEGWLEAARTRVDLERTAGVALEVLAAESVGASEPLQ